MSLTVGELTGYLRLDRSDFNRGMDRSESRFKGLGRTLARGAAVAGAAVGAGVLVAGKALWDTGKQLEGWANRANTVFADSISSVQAVGDEVAHAMGMTKAEFTGASAAIGDLLIPMGFAREEAAKMSADTVALAGALSEWTGGAVDSKQASEILAKAYLGERDALTSLGIKISEADVKARLAKKGQEDLTGAALEQARALATQELVFEKSTDAQDAFAKGTNRTQRAQAIASATIRESWQKVAAKALPILANIAEFVAERLPGALATAEAFIERWWPVIVGAFRQVKRIVDIVMSIFRDPDITSDGWVGTVESIVVTVLDMVGKMRKYLDQVKGIFNDAMDAVKSIIAVALNIVRGFWDRFGKHILSFLRTTWSNIQRVIKGALDIIQGVFRLVTSILTGDWSKAWESIKQILRGAWSIIKGVISQAFNIIKTVFGAGVAAITQVWSWLWNAIKTAASAAWRNVTEGVSRGIDRIRDFLRGLPDRAKSWLGSLGYTLYSKGKDLIAGFLNGIKNKAGDIVSTIKSYVTDKIPSFVKKALGIGSPSKVMMNLGEWTAAGMEAGIKAKAKAVEQAAKTIADAAVPSNLSQMTAPAYAVASAGAAGMVGAPAPAGNTYHTYEIHGRDPAAIGRELESRQWLASRGG